MSLPTGSIQAIEPLRPEQAKDGAGDEAVEDSVKDVHQGGAEMGAEPDGVWDSSEGVGQNRRGAGDLKDRGKRSSGFEGQGCQIADENHKKVTLPFSNSDEAWNSRDRSWRTDRVTTRK